MDQTEFLLWLIIILTMGRPLDSGLILTGVEGAVVDCHGAFALANLADNVEEGVGRTSQLEDDAHDASVERLAFFQQVGRRAAGSLGVPVESLALHAGRRLTEGKLTLLPLGAVH